QQGADPIMGSVVGAWHAAVWMQGPGTASRRPPRGTPPRYGRAGCTHCLGMRGIREAARERSRGAAAADRQGFGASAAWRLSYTGQVRGVARKSLVVAGAAALLAWLLGHLLGSSAAPGPAQTDPRPAPA